MINRDVEVKNWLIEARCGNEFSWNHSTGEKSCDVDEYLDYVNRKCKKRLIDNLVEEYNEDIDRNEIS